MLTKTPKSSKTLIQLVTLAPEDPKNNIRLTKIVIINATAIIHSLSLVRIVMKMTSYRPTIRTHYTWRNSHTLLPKRSTSIHAMEEVIRQILDTSRGARHSIKTVAMMVQAESARICRCSKWDMEDCLLLNQWNQMSTPSRTVPSLNHAGIQVEAPMLDKE